MSRWSKQRKIIKEKKKKGRKLLGVAISEGKGHNAIQAAARRAKIAPSSARNLEKILSKGIF